MKVIANKNCKYFEEEKKEKQTNLIKKASSFFIYYCKEKSIEISKRKDED